MDLPYLLRRASRSFPEVRAVDDGHRSLTLRALVEQGARIARGLDQLGVPAGAPVGLLSENRTEYVEADVAIMMGSRLRVALNSRLHLDDFRYMVRDSGMRAIFHSAQHAETAAKLHEEFGVECISLDDDASSRHFYRGLAGGPGSGAAPGPENSAEAADDERPAWITYTSGSTGRPKGVVLSHRAIYQCAVNLMLEFPAEPGTQIVLTQPLSHGSAYFLLPQFMSGAGIYVCRGFDPEEVLRVGQRPGVSTVKIVPAMIPRLLESLRGPWPFSTTVYGASPIGAATLSEALERFGPTLVQVYGQSEAPTTLTCLSKKAHLDPESASAAGLPWRTVALEVHDADGQPVRPGEPGELVARAPHVMTRYLGLPEATADVLRDGWLHTRDFARIDDRGFVHLIGRSDEMINSGGYNIAPREVEAVLTSHPSVREAFVFGMPDARWGAAVHAAVVGNDPALTAESLVAFARPRLGFRCPKEVLILQALPRTHYGKVDTAQIKSLMKEQQP